jgi:hypothetical protein
MGIVSSRRAKFNFLPVICIAASLASPALGDSCKPWQEVEKQINNCGSNAVAVEHAQACLTIVTRESGAALETLRTARSSRNRGVLSAAINDVAEQIKTVQEQTAAVADYTKAMIDDPGSHSRETSLECFNTSFDKLQKVVSGMDRKIIEMKKALEAAVKARGRLAK